MLQGFVHLLSLVKLYCVTINLKPAYLTHAVPVAQIKIDQLSAGQNKLKSTKYIIYVQVPCNLLLVK